MSSCIDERFVGPNGLGISYGQPPDRGVSAGVEEAIQAALAVARATGTACGIQTFDAARRRT